MAMLEYFIQVNGAGEAERAIRGVDGAARDTAGGMEDLDRRFEDAAKGADEVGQKARGAGEGLADADQRADGLSGRLSTLVGGFDAVGAAITAAMATVGASKLLSLAEEGGQLQVISRNLEEIGVTADDVTDIIARLGGGSRSEIELLISRVDAMGVSFDEMGGLADAALRISIERGEDSHVIFNKLIRAIATGKQTYLQQLGITLDLKTAWDAYAKSVGKTRAELTETEKANISSTLAIEELNQAFGDRAPDKYASNIGEVRDRFNNLADAIKRLAGDALERLGAVLAGGLFNATFASDPLRSRTEQIEDQIEVMNDAIERLDSAARKGAASVADTVLEIQDEVGVSAFAAMLGIPGDAEVTRITAAYIGARDRIAASLATAEDQLVRAQVDEDFVAAQIEAMDAADAAHKQASQKGRQRRDDDLAAEREAYETRWRLARAYFDRRAAAEDEAAQAAQAARDQAAQAERESRARSAAEAEHYRDVLDQQLAEAEAAVQGLAGEIYASGRAWASWADEIESALAMVESIAGSIRVAYDAIVAGELTSQRNAVIRAQEQQQAAESAEERAAAERKVYEAQLALAKAEEDAAKARQVFMAIEYALEGAKMTAKAMESAALASYLAALPYGAGLPFVPAAIASTVAYGLAAAAYGTAAVATISADVPRSPRPTPPSSDRETIDAGNRERVGEQQGNLYVEFKGGALHTQTEIQETVVRALDEHGRRRGRSTFDVGRLDRRRGGR